MDMWIEKRCVAGGLSMRRVLVIHFADCCILDTTKETKKAESTRVETRYETSVVRGEEMFRL